MKQLGLASTAATASELTTVPREALGALAGNVEAQPPRKSESSEPSRTAVGTMSSLLPRASIPPAQRRKRLLVGFAALAAVAGAIVIALVFRQGSHPEPLTSTLSAVPERSPQPVTPDSAPAPSAETPSAVASATESAAPPPSAAPAEPKRRPKVTRRTAVPRPPTSECNPPYYYKDGVKHLKTKCL
jgi:hypothetical protein